MVKYTANIYSTARFLESDRIEILRRGSKGLVGGAVHSWWLWPLPCTAPPDIPLLPLLPSTYGPSCILLTAPPENSFSCSPALYLLPLLHFAYCPSWKFLFLPLLPFTYCPSCCNCSFAAPPSFWLMSLDKLTVMAIPIVEF